jgi:hypothetical protein
VLSSAYSEPCQHKLVQHEILVNMKAENHPCNAPSIVNYSDNVNTFHQSLEFRVKWGHLYVRTRWSPKCAAYKTANDCLITKYGTHSLHKGEKFQNQFSTSTDFSKANRHLLSINTTTLSETLLRQKSKDHP